jgi:arginyl-tRNA synthetase
VGGGKTVLVEYSSPNIAKPLGIHHLRSTVIGESVKRIAAFTGHKVEGINHLGDWGTQFGQLIYAHKTWGNEALLEKEPMRYLLDIYVRFNKEVELDASLQERAREWFKRLEDGDAEAVLLWTRFRDVSLREFERMYAMLGIRFDHLLGEQFYIDKTPRAELESKGLLQESEGARVVELKPFGMPPLIFQKSDEASTYHARDLGAAVYRLRTHNPERILYVVGHQQELHFRQLFKVLELMGHPGSRFVHVSFGMLRLPEGKLSTRKGNVVYMEDVFTEAVTLARKIINKKNPDLKSKDDVAKQVGIGAVVFGDLVNDRNRDVLFDWDKILDFEGDTGPYVQYTHARSSSLLEKAKREAGWKDGKTVDVSHLKQPEEHALIRTLAQFPDAVAQAWVGYRPHHVAQYLLQLCRTFNVFYHGCPVLTAQSAELRDARLALVEVSRQVIRNGLFLLNVAAPDEM